jgi:hypothetical protein
MSMAIRFLILELLLVPEYPEPAPSDGIAIE